MTKSGTTHRDARSSGWRGQRAKRRSTKFTGSAFSAARLAAGGALFAKLLGRLSPLRVEPSRPLSPDEAQAVGVEITSGRLQ